MPRRSPLVVTLLLLLLVATGCRTWQPVPLGGAGRPVASVAHGTAVDLRFAAPRRLPGLPQPVARLRGTVERARGDTLFVRVSETAPLGGELRVLGREATVPVVMDRDVAAELREPSRRRLALVAVGVAALVAAVVVTQ